MTRDAVAVQDPLHDHAGAGTQWTIVNIAENFPDIATPLGWSFWARPLETALRGAFCDLGALRPRRPGTGRGCRDRAMESVQGVPGLPPT